MRRLVEWFDRYGEPQFIGNSPERNRKRLTAQRTKPSSKPRGGARKTSGGMNARLGG